MSTTSVTEPTLSQEQKSAQSALKTTLGSGYRKAQKAMASIATAIVDFRMTFTKDGKPDYRGETLEYRGAIGQVYEEILADEDERASFKQAIRYWISKEFQTRVQDGKLDASELADSGISRPARKKKAAAATSSTRSSAKKNGEVVHSDNGVVKTAAGKPLSPKEVFKAAENIAVEYLVDIGPVTMVRSVTSELKALLEAIDSPDAGINPEVSVFRGAVKNLLTVSLALAEKSGVEVPGMATAEVQTPEPAKDDSRLTPRKRGRPRKTEKQEEKHEASLVGISWPS